ncbi:hypothetical protein FA15DRAFT_757650 [Coprinopsis marcescibilis]|uniref:F-box domain-containing protein n=1 Tax=Coprinopsis marcescibilis TaxID=230819 RepID=A0A5C3KR53_COPMA|nr:hypothetical protein FA15DRAFT_757650 [Coprinopsis marcescibilis]
MPGASFSQELLGRIVQFVEPKRIYLLHLCLVSKAFQREAEARLYSYMAFVDPRRAQLACRTIVESDRLASLVKQFWFTQEHNLRQGHTRLPRSFWALIRQALVQMRNLEILSLQDYMCENSWIFDAPDIKFQLIEARLRSSWDSNTVRFLNTQQKLRWLQFVDPRETLGAGSLGRDKGLVLPNLAIFEGNSSVGNNFLATSPLTHMQIAADAHTGANLRHLPKTIISLNILELPESSVVTVVDTVSQTCPAIRHLGQLALPVLHREGLLYCLTRLKYLRSVEVDITHWSPIPIPNAQRSLAAELKTFAPSLRTVVFWVKHNRFRWIHNPQTQFWSYKLENNQHRMGGHLWLQM